MGRSTIDDVGTELIGIESLIDVEATAKQLANYSTPIDLMIKECTDDNELLMLSCILLERAKEIMDNQLTEEGRKLIFQEYI